MTTRMIDEVLINWTTEAGSNMFVFDGFGSYDKLITCPSPNVATLNTIKQWKYTSLYTLQEKTRFPSRQGRDDQWC